MRKSRRIHPAVIIVLEVVIGVVFFIVFFHAVLPALFELINSFYEGLENVVVPSHSYQNLRKIGGEQFLLDSKGIR